MRSLRSPPPPPPHAGVEILLLSLKKNAWEASPLEAIRYRKFLYTNTVTMNREPDDASPTRKEPKTCDGSL